MHWIIACCLIFQTICSAEISRYLAECFPDTEPTAIIPLGGGYSGSEHFLIDLENQRFVLKLYPERYSQTQQAKRELLTFKQASEAGIAPKIHWISLDSQAILIDFVDGELLTMATAQKPEHLIAIANTLRKVHNLPKSPYMRRGFVQRMEELYDYLKTSYKIPPELEAAMQKIKENPLPLKGPQATIHGDLNARNIFLTANGVQLIDWSETCWEDPNYDLTCFVLLHNLGPAEEELFLQTYFGQSPSPDQMAHYQHIKQINLVDLSVNLIFLANTMSEDLQDRPLLDISYYLIQFADNREDLSAQFFYDWGRSFLQKENLVNVEWGLLRH